MANQKILDWNAMVASGSMPPGVEQVSDNFTFDSAKHSAAHPTAGTFSVFGGDIPGTPTQFQSYFSTTTEYLAGLEGASVTKVETVGWVTTITWDVSFTFAMSYTSFQIASGDESTHAAELASVISSTPPGADKTHYAGVMITASPDRPSGALTPAQQGKTYESDLLNIACGGCQENTGPVDGGQGVLLKIVQNESGASRVANYDSNVCSHNGAAAGQWAGSNLYYAGGFSGETASLRRLDGNAPIVVEELYFELADGTKLKLTSGKLPNCT